MSLLVTAMAVFELQLPITCGDTENLLRGIRERYGEEIIFMSPSVNQIGENLTHSLWINPETKTWTWIVVNKEKNTTCVVNSGDKYQFFGPPMI